MSLTFSGCRSGTSISTLSTLETDGKAAKASRFRSQILESSTPW